MNLQIERTSSVPLHRQGEQWLRKQIAIPKDVAVAGNGGFGSTENFCPALTTSRISVLELGRTAADLLLQVIANPNAPARHVKLPTSLVIRDSA